MVVPEPVPDLVVDEHLAVGVHLVVTERAGALRPPIGVDHDALGGRRVARDVVLGRVETGFPAPHRGGAGARQGDDEVRASGRDPLEGTGAAVAPTAVVV